MGWQAGTEVNTIAVDSEVQLDSTLDRTYVIDMATWGVSGTAEWERLMRARTWGMDIGKWRMTYK